MAVQMSLSKASHVVAAISLPSISRRRRMLQLRFEFRKHPEHLPQLPGEFRHMYALWICAVLRISLWLHRGFLSTRHQLFPSQSSSDHHWAIDIDLPELTQMIQRRLLSSEDAYKPRTSWECCQPVPSTSAIKIVFFHQDHDAAGLADASTTAAEHCLSSQLIRSIVLHHWWPSIVSIGRPANMINTDTNPICHRATSNSSIVSLAHCSAFLDASTALHSVATTLFKNIFITFVRLARAWIYPEQVVEHC